MKRRRESGASRPPRWQEEVFFIDTSLPTVVNKIQRLQRLETVNYSQASVP